MGTSERIDYGCIEAGGGMWGHRKERYHCLKRTTSGFPPRGTKARPVVENDFLLAIQKVKKTGESAREFHKKEFLRGREERASMAADISRATNSSSGRKTRIEKAETDTDNSGDKDSTSSTNKRSQGGEKNGKTKNSQVIDIQQIMAVAMAAAVSMNSVDENTLGQAYDFGLNGNSSIIQGSADTDYDDDVPPEISETDTE